MSNSAANSEEVVNDEDNDEWLDEMDEYDVEDDDDDNNDDRAEDDDDPVDNNSVTGGGSNVRSSQDKSYGKMSRDELLSNLMVMVSPSA